MTIAFGTTSTGEEVDQGILDVRTATETDVSLKYERPIRVQGITDVNNMRLLTCYTFTFKFNQYHHFDDRPPQRNKAYLLWAFPRLADIYHINVHIHFFADKNALGEGKGP